MVEVFKKKSNLNPTFIDTFTERDVLYNLRSKNHMQLLNVKTAKYGIKSIHVYGPHY